MMSNRIQRDPDVVRRSLYYWRKERRMTVEQVGKRLGMHYTAVSQYERGTRSIPVTNLVKLAAIYNVDVVDLFKEPPTHHAGELPEELSQ